MTVVDIEPFARECDKQARRCKSSSVATGAWSAFTIAAFVIYGHVAFLPIAVWLVALTLGFVRLCRSAEIRADHYRNHPWVYGLGPLPKSLTWGDDA